MRKTLITTAILSLMLSMTAFGQGVKGKMFIGGYGGYTLGFGDAFYDEEESFEGVTYKASFKPGINLGGTFHYGVSEKFMVGGELGFQAYVEKYSAGGSEESETYNKNSILFNGLYALNYVEGKNAMFLTFGAGLRQFPDYEFGFFGGLVYRIMVSEKVGLCGMPRFHYIMTDGDAPMMFSLSVGVLIPIGQ